MVFDILIHQVFVSESDNKKEITIVCNVDNHNLDFINERVSFESSCISTNGGAYVTINEPVIVLKDCFVLRLTYER